MSGPSVIVERSPTHEPGLVIPTRFARGTQFFVG